ncbi:MAG: exodeoxyribonuclease VII small subunit [Acidobacteria bacterium]|nr:MAG: exodeoxyribonuclease VII small subunit [Acidobacteriota bacterium]REK02558.1 MAG: exodeoxyribonuclease VII small subunit [Acidobacteriota bacterium]REK13639.1 MAG: exodeoxyribonuclease VII small subunit [Acidobacteriota bacterium]REK41633.1 MAG: exodeoxyribonuclease VII small subunit [Acidobacteriota bacterium]
MSKENNGSFEESLEALEGIVKKLEEGELPLEKSLELFEEGVRLSRKCQQKLEKAERRIEMLVKDDEGNPALEAFEEEPED